MGFVTFMRSGAGRGTRIIAGAAIIIVGLALVRGAAGTVIAVFGLVPLLAGIFNFCLFAPLFGMDFTGRRRA
jgi:ABC-type uncharacterized transport system YnjBCD permease subunit